MATLWNIERTKMIAIPERIREYIVNGPMRTISKDAPDEIKKEAQEINSAYFEHTGKHFFLIEDK